METTRETAIRLLLEFMDMAGPTREDAGAVVDAIVAAARSAESEHTRAVEAAQQKAERG